MRPGAARNFRRPSAGPQAGFFKKGLIAWLAGARPTADLTARAYEGPNSRDYQALFGSVGVDCRLAPAASGTFGYPYHKHHVSLGMHAYEQYLNQDIIYT